MIYNIMRYLIFLVLLLLLSMDISISKKIKKLYQKKQERRQLEKELVGIRGLEFLKLVKYRTMKKEDVKNKIQDKMGEEPIVKDEVVLKKFGFLKKDETILPHITRLYTEQVQGMYDEDSGDMFIVKGLPLTGNLQRMFLVHELTHALQDQHFNLKGLPLNSENDDTALACLALIEGDATLAMFEYYKNNLKIYKIFWDLLSYLSVDQSEFYSSPYYIRENLIFPYKWGIRFVTGRTWDGIDKLYKDPPGSTEQIMHPERYPEDKPVDIDISENIPEWRLLDSNTMGEFNIRVLFSIYLGEYESILPTKGWGGDKWQVWEEPDTGKLRIIWYTIWDTSKDAEEFFNAFKRLIGKRHRDVASARISKIGTKVNLYW